MKQRITILALKTATRAIKLLTKVLRQIDVYAWERRMDAEVLAPYLMPDGTLDVEKIMAEARPIELLWAELEREADEDLTAGRYEDFDNMDDFIASLDDPIDI